MEPGDRPVPEVEWRALSLDMNALDRKIRSLPAGDRDRVIRRFGQLRPDCKDILLRMLESQS